MPFLQLFEWMTVGSQGKPDGTKHRSTIAVAESRENLGGYLLNRGPSKDTGTSQFG
jgi:hypothetical protein